MAAALAGAGSTGAGSAAVGGAIEMGVAAHVRGQNWSRQKNVLQKAIQWRVADLRAAGLNPVLAATGNLGAGTAPSLTGPSSSGLAGAMAAGAGVGIKASKAKQEIATLSAQAKSSTAQAANSTEQALNAAATRPQIHNLVQTSASDARSAKAKADQAEYLLPEYKAMAEMWADPVMGPLLKGKYLLQGTPLMRWNPNSARGQRGLGDRLPAQSTHPRGPLIKGRHGKNFADPNFKR